MQLRVGTLDARTGKHVAKVERNDICAREHDHYGEGRRDKEASTVRFIRESLCQSLATFFLEKDCIGDLAVLDLDIVNITTVDDGENFERFVVTIMADEPAG